jgi:hypothetical protein
VKSESGTNWGLLSKINTQIVNEDLRDTICSRHFGPKAVPRQAGETAAQPPVCPGLCAARPLRIEAEGRFRVTH